MMYTLKKYFIAVIQGNNDGLNLFCIYFIHLDEKKKTVQIINV